MNKITHGDLANPEFVRAIREYAAVLARKQNISFRAFRDWLSNTYRDLRVSITDETGAEVFLNLDCFEGTDEFKEEADPIVWWFRDFLTPPPSHITPYVRVEAKERVAVLATILSANDPAGTAHWWAKSLRTTAKTKTKEGTSSTSKITQLACSSVVALAFVFSSLPDARAQSEPDFEIPAEWEIRGCDQKGCGIIGAPRVGGRKHKGTDFLLGAGEVVLSPSSGVVTNIGYPYFDDLSYRLIDLDIGNGCQTRIFYVDPAVAVGDLIETGDVLGTAQSLKKKFGPLMPDHVHVELRCAGQVLDPASF